MSQIFIQMFSVRNDNKDRHVITVVNDIPITGNHLTDPNVKNPGDFTEGLGYFNNLLPLFDIAWFLEPAEHDMMKSLLVQ